MRLGERMFGKLRLNFQKLAGRVPGESTRVGQPNVSVIRKPLIKCDLEGIIRRSVRSSLSLTATLGRRRRSNGLDPNGNRQGATYILLLQLPISVSAPAFNRDS